MVKPSTGTPAVPRAMRLGDMLTLKDQTDETGRLLLEDSAPPQALRQAKRSGVAMETVVCEYPDTPSRRGGLMNASAYDALRNDTAQILRTFAWLSRHYLDVKPLSAGKAQSLLDVSNLGVTLPLVLFYRASDPVPRYGGLPSYIASTFKASRGVFSAAVDMVNRKGASTPVTAAGVVEFVEQNGHLMRQATRRVCAAPTKLIERTIAALLSGDPADAAKTGIDDYISFDELWAFYSLQDSYAQAVSRYRFVLDRLVAGGSPGEDMRRVIKRLAGAVVTEGGRTGTFGQFTDAMLVHANSVQAGLNRLLGRAGEAPPLTFDDMVRTL